MESDNITVETKQQLHWGVEARNVEQATHCDAHPDLQVPAKCMIPIQLPTGNYTWIKKKYKTHIYIAKSKSNLSQTVGGWEAPSHGSITSNSRDQEEGLDLAESWMETTRSQK